MEWKDLFFLIWEQRARFLGIFGGMIALGILWILVAPKTYEAETLFLYRENPAVSPAAALTMPGGGFPGLAGLLGGGNLDNQLSLLNSLDLYVDVCRRLSQEDLDYLLKPKAVTWPIRKLKRILLPPAPPRPRYVKAAYKLRDRVQIEPVGASTVIRLVYRDVDRDRLLRVIQALRESAQRISQKVNADFYARAARSLQGQVKVVEDSLQKAQETLIQFQRETGLLIPIKQVEALAATLQKLAELRAQADAQRAGFRARLEETDSLTLSWMTGLLDSALYHAPETRVLWDTLVTLRTEYTMLQISGMDTLQGRMPELRRRIQEIERRLAQAFRRQAALRVWGDPAILLDSLQGFRIQTLVALADLKAQQQALQHWQDSLNAVLEDLPEDMARWLQLKMRVEYLAQLSTTLRAMRDQVMGLAQNAIASFYPIQEPYPPGDPVSPNPVLILFLSVVLGGVMAFTGVVGPEVLFPRIHRPRMVEDLFSRPVLAEAHLGEIASWFPAVIFRWYQRNEDRESLMVLGLVGTFPDTLSGEYEQVLQKWMPRLGEVQVEEVRPGGDDFFQEDWSTKRLLVCSVNDAEDPRIREVLLRADAVVFGIHGNMPVQTVQAWMQDASFLGAEVLGFVFFQHLRP